MIYFAKRSGSFDCGFGMATKVVDTRCSGMSTSLRDLLIQLTAWCSVDDIYNSPLFDVRSGTYSIECVESTLEPAFIKLCELIDHAELANESIAVKLFREPDGRTIERDEYRNYLLDRQELRCWKGELERALKILKCEIRLGAVEPRPVKDPYKEIIDEFEAAFSSGKYAIGILDKEYIETQSKALHENLSTGRGVETIKKTVFLDVSKLNLTKADIESLIWNATHDGVTLKLGDEGLELIYDMAVSDESEKFLGL